MKLPIKSSFLPVSIETMHADALALWNRLPEDYQKFLLKHNGGAVGRYELNFFTGIPYPDENALLQSRPDDIESFLGFDNRASGSLDDLLAYNFNDKLNVFPEETITVARSHYGSLGICLGEFDFGAVYYNWTHFPSVADFYRNKDASSILRGNLAGSEAQEYQAFERLASTWKEMLALLQQSEGRNEKSSDLKILGYDVHYEQIKRRAAYNNVAVMIGAAPNSEQEAILQAVSSGFLPSYWEETLRTNALAEPSLLTVRDTLGDSWIMDQMLKVLMLDELLDPAKYDILLQFCSHIGYPKIELDRSISDFHGLQERKTRRQAPSLEEMMQDSRENAITTIQSIYLVAIADGEITPARDAFFIGIARENHLDPEELMFIVRHRTGLDLMPPKFGAWAETMRNELDRFLKIGHLTDPDSLKMADRLYSLWA